MQGVFINGNRPKSKKQIREAVQPPTEEHIRLEATSMFGDEYDGDVFAAPNGTYYFVGPDPYTKRSFYGKFVVANGKVKVQ